LNQSLLVANCSQEAFFVPATDDAEDTSYFEERGLQGVAGAHDGVGTSGGCVGSASGSGSGFASGICVGSPGSRCDTHTRKSGVAVSAQLLATCRICMPWLVFGASRRKIDNRRSP
jgi:hypothetical protein